VDSNGRTIWIADAHRDEKRYLVRADEMLSAFMELELQQMRSWILLAVTAVTLWFGAALAQQPSPQKAGLKRFERFVGAIRSVGAERRVAIQVWLIPNDRKVLDLERPFRGLTVIEVRGGSVYTKGGDGEPKRRLAGEFWTVPPGGMVTFETRDDSAAVQTTVVGE
jgi:hypothetical protein